MDSLKCRAYTRKNLREQKVYMDEMEHNVKQKEAKLKTILMENEKYIDNYKCVIVIIILYIID